MTDQSAMTADQIVESAERCLRGTLVRLRPVREDDLSQLAHWWIDPATAVRQAGVMVPRPLEETTDQLRAWTRSDWPSGVAFAIVDVTSDELLGWVSLHSVLFPAASAVLGVTLRPDRTSRGLGTEAVRLIVRYGFEFLGLHRIHLEVFAFNDRAIRSYEKVGFVTEGRLREAVFQAGRRHDVIVMSMLATDQRP